MMHKLMLVMAGIAWLSLSPHTGNALAQDNKGRQQVEIDLGNGVKMKFVEIKAGRFMMGSKDDCETGAVPEHEVTLTKDYWIQTTETTQAQWEAVMGTNPSHFKGADLPVETVSWEDCQKFLKKLNEKAKDQLKGKTAALPTEAQWEYACRAAEKGKWCFGDDEKKLGEYAWHSNNADDKTHPVAQKKANAWGLYDMHGNVWEWCEDWFGAYEDRAVTDPTGPVKGEQRCMRGGSYNLSTYTPSAIRGKCLSTELSSNIGLRVTLR